MKKSFLAGLSLAVLAMTSGAQANSLCPVLQTLTDAAQQDFTPIKGQDMDSGAYDVTVMLPLADGCKLDRTLEKDFGELRYKCDFSSLNFQSGGEATLAEGVANVSAKYAGFIAECRPDLNRKQSESVWAKTTTFVDSGGRKWLDVSASVSDFTVTVFTPDKNPNY